MKHEFESFGILSFSEKDMRERLPFPVYTKWKTALSKESPLDRPTADAIAHAMKMWAIEHGATHYTHWFQPISGRTAEKHDSFLESDENGSPLIRFSGKKLIKGEADGSSFPSGGLRATFEARGYTYWDMSSPVYIRDKTLCIPTIFVSYHGQSLDLKSPFLKALEMLSVQASRVVRVLGAKQVKQVNLSVGLEQEYFLVDKSYYRKRDDLRFSGRTLLGASAPKGQEMEDHYYGSIPERVQKFMHEVNLELWKLGITAKVEHNEVAPAQFEISCIFQEANIAVDQNLIVMDILCRIANHHDFVCLLHEKPFEGINGSGKHNNWSLITDDGQNIFEPGDKPAENIRFLVFVAAVIKAIDSYPELIRLSSSGPGNDERLGANEAPPAIVSMFLGDVLDGLFMELADQKVSKKTIDSVKSAPLRNLAYLPKDNADRNRTSPFAFTGNKFELRMLGSSLNGSFVNTIIATTLADVLKPIADHLETFKYTEEIRDEALVLVQDILRKHHRILFGGDGYGEAWVEEAKRRGLPNIPSYVDAIAYLGMEKNRELFKRHDLYNDAELDARMDIMYEAYTKTILIESKTLLSMVERDFLDALHTHIAKISTLDFLKKERDELIEASTKIRSLCTNLKIAIEKVSSLEDAEKQGHFAKDTLYKINHSIREIVDECESKLPQDLYPFPSYKELLFDFD